MKYAFYALLINAAFTFTATQVKAQATYRNQIGDRLDNDQYINPYHDRYYLAGQFINFTTVLNTKKDCAGLFGSTVVKKTLEFEVGQQIYGPFASWAREPFLQDRPYTGYLYAGAALTWLYEDESSLKVTAQLGTIGPASLAEKVQKAFHHAFDLKDPEGWQYQLNNAIGVNLEAQYTRLLYRNSGEWFDIAATPSLRLGTTFSNATAGLQFRIGGLDKFYQSASTNSRVSMGGDRQKTEFYLFAIPQLSYIGYDATIQGGMFIKDKGPVHYDAIKLVFTQQLGVQFASRRISASFTAFLRSREVGGGSSALAHQWGSIATSYRFGKN